jgi:hypothetical protein
MIYLYSKFSKASLDVLTTTDGLEILCLCIDNVPRYADIVTPAMLLARGEFLDTAQCLERLRHPIVTYCTRPPSVMSPMSTVSQMSPMPPMLPTMSPLVEEMPPLPVPVTLLKFNDAPVESVMEAAKRMAEQREQEQ